MCDASGCQGVNKHFHAIYSKKPQVNRAHILRNVISGQMRQCNYVGTNLLNNFENTSETLDRARYKILVSFVDMSESKNFTELSLNIFFFITL